jgi:hypothetical protein
MTKKEAIVLSAYTGTALAKFSDIHEYIEQVLKRPVFTHELAEKEIWEKIKEACHEDFMVIVNNII